MEKRLVSIVLPAHNESGNIRFIKNRIASCFPFEQYNLELIFVNDGSTDDTLQQIQDIAEEDNYVYYIELSRNFGHQSALKAGLDSANGDCIISMDCDLQHPPELISTMLKKWEEGYDIVYTRRQESENISFFKRKTSNLFYSFFNKFSDTQIEKGTADFRLMSRQVANVFIDFKETDIFIRGMIKWMGFKQLSVDYEANDRFSGVSKYSPKKMITLAIQAVTSFSVKPLYAAVYLGFTLSLIALLYLPYVLYSFFYSKHYESGWASVILSIVFFSGLQLSVLGIIGLYLGKMFMQVKNRPLYIVRSSNLPNVSTTK
ncbi:MAG: glycosyltransferase family 2 protein [Paludibacteraceae bacterium]|nr:glycosyltransferase family 2 protein [Paludibacteraceae bacterium]